MKQFNLIILFFFIIYTSFSQVTDEDYILINLTINDIESINTQEKNQKLEIININIIKIMK